MASPAAAAQPPPAAEAPATEASESPKPDPAADAMRQKLRAIMAINNDASLSDEEKARRRQDVMMGKWASPAAGKENRDGECVFFFFEMRGTLDRPTDDDDDDGAPCGAFQNLWAVVSSSYAGNRTSLALRHHSTPLINPAL